jgi:hypothetical protein
MDMSWIIGDRFPEEVRISLFATKSSTVGIGTGYGLDDRGSIPGGGYEFISSASCPDRL